MKMIMAFVRPEMVERVSSTLGKDGFIPYTPHPAGALLRELLFLMLSILIFKI